MNIGYLRASSANTYLDCPFKFFLHFVVGFTSNPGKKAVLGTAAHWVLELLGKAKKTNHYLLGDKYSDYKYLTEIVWARILKQHPEFTFTKADHKFVLDQVESVVFSKYNPLRMKILKTEHQFQIQVQRSGFYYHHANEITDQIHQGFMELRGTIDLITEFDEDTIEVIDYKTGQRTDWITGEVKEFDKFFSDLQLRMYDLATSQLYAKYKNRLLTIIFTRDGGPFTVSFNTQDWEHSLAEFRKIFQRIKDDKLPSRLLDDPTKGLSRWKCNYVCQFGKYQHVYMDDEGSLLFSEHKNTKTDLAPEEIIKDDKVFVKISNEKGSRVCDEYYSILQTHGLKTASQKLYQLRIDVEGVPETSRRNDYSNDSIDKRIIQ